jgi:hypothetical protein
MRSHPSCEGMSRPSWGNPIEPLFDVLGEALNRLRKNLAAALLIAPLTLTAACSGGDVDADAPSVDVDPGNLDADAPEVDAPDVDAPDVDAPDVDVDADVESEEDADEEAGPDESPSK